MVKNFFFSKTTQETIPSTRYSEAIALRRVDTETVLDALLHFFGRFGFPKEILIC